MLEGLGYNQKKIEFLPNSYAILNSLYAKPSSDALNLLLFGVTVCAFYAVEGGSVSSLWMQS